MSNGTPAPDALQRLREGNRRFVAGTRRDDARAIAARREGLVSGQAPFAVILGCSDSRVPVELVFDQGFGDVFVIRVAGNIVTPAVRESIEFAVENLETRLVIVLGHSHCGAVAATLDALQRAGGTAPGSLGTIGDHIRPAVEPLLATEAARDADALWHAAVRANVRAAAERLAHGSETLARRVQQDEVLVVGAEYSLASGVVEFFHDVPDAARR